MELLSQEATKPKFVMLTSIDVGKMIIKIKDIRQVYSEEGVTAVVCKKTRVHAVKESVKRVKHILEFEGF